MYVGCGAVVCAATPPVQHRVQVLNNSIEVLPEHPIKHSMGLNFIIILDSRRVLHPAPARLRQAGIQNTDPRGTLGYNTQTREARWGYNTQTREAGWDTKHRPARQAGIQNTDPRGRLGYKTQTREAGWDTKHISNYACWRLVEPPKLHDVIMRDLLAAAGTCGRCGRRPLLDV